MHKIWVGLITCASSRAVYLDVVPDCSGKSCINLLTRFICSRGAPNVIISDNGSSFQNKEVQNFITSRGITWKFNVPLAPWMGGFFESMVKSSKNILRKFLYKVRLNYVELITLLKEVENVINSRPLSYVYYDDLSEPLTPNKLIYGKNISVHVSNFVPNDETQLNLHDRFNQLELNLDLFWGVWKKDYLTNLREAHQKRFKRARHSIDPSVDDVVLVHDEKLKRGAWKMGRIQTLKFSVDGKCRSAEVVVMSNGKRIVIERPVNLLYPIEESVSRASNDT